jgi:putative ABC transport system ATP-binding protein
VDEPVVELLDVWRIYDSEPPVYALRGVDLVVERGDHVAIVGPSGSGKSTLLNVIGCLDRPTLGTYRLDGIDVSSLDDRQLAAARGTRIGFVFQSFHLLAHRTVVENVMLGELYRGTDRTARKAHALDAIERVGLAHRSDFVPSRLSGGERQRVAIARALVGDPALLLADEPTGNLDTANTEAILDLFVGLRDEGLTIVVITHDRQVSDSAKRVVEIVDGTFTSAA